MRRISLKFTLTLLLATALFPMALLASEKVMPVTVDEPVVLQRAYLIAQNTAAPASEGAVTVAAPAAVEASEPEIKPPTKDEISAFIESLGGVKGASTLAIIALVIQGLMLAFRTQLGEFAGKWRFLIVVGLTWVSGAVAMKVQGMDWIPALLHPATVASFQVFAHQTIKQLFTDKGDKV